MRPLNQRRPIGQPRFRAAVGKRLQLFGLRRNILRPRRQLFVQAACGGLMRLVTTTHYIKKLVDGIFKSEGFLRARLCDAVLEVAGDGHLLAQLRDCLGRCAQRQPNPTCHIRCQPSEPKKGRHHAEQHQTN